MKQSIFFLMLAGLVPALTACSISSMMDMELNSAPIEEVLEDCRDGDLNQCRLAGNRYRSGNNAPKDLDLAVECYSIACEKGEMYECEELYEIGFDFLVGKQTAEDLVRTMNLFDISCAGGYGPACTTLGEGYMEGRGVKKDPAKAFPLYLRGCDTGSARGCSYAGDHYMKSDVQRAQSIYEKACDWDDTYGCAALGSFYLEGKGGEQDDQLAYEYFLKSCNKNPSNSNSAGCLALGQLYATGRGVAQDKTEAVRYYRLACYVSRPKQPAACVKLAQACRVGEGVDKDDNCAHEYFRRACDLGSEEGCLGMHQERCTRFGQAYSCNWLKEHDNK